MSQVNRPAEVTRAVWLIAASLALGVFRCLVVPPAGPLWIAYVTVALMVGLTYAIAKRGNWARIVFVVLFLLGLPAIFFVRELLLREGTFAVVVLVLQTFMQLAALVLLFLPNSRRWFRRSGATSEIQPEATAREV